MMAVSMAADVINELETSAQILLSPPNIVTNDRRHCAEEVFLRFRKTKSPFVLCKHILELLQSQLRDHIFYKSILFEHVLSLLSETSKVEYVLFQTAALLREAVIREWPLLEKTTVQNLRSYLLGYVVHNPNLQGYVREQILQVIAIIVKRGGIEDAAEEREGILTEVSNIINSGDMGLQTIGCSILSSLLNEYAITIKSNDIGLTWETHFQAKKDFEATDLKRIFRFCLQVLCEMERSPESRELISLLNRFLGITEQILSWNFFYSNLPRKVVGVFEADQSPYLRPGPTWRDTILDPNVVELFYRIHFKIRCHPDVSHHSLNCLTQLASLHGTVFGTMDSRIQYLTCLLQGLHKLMTSGNILEHEVIGLANVISKMVLFFPSSILLQLSSEVLNSFLEQLTAFSCHCCVAASRESASNKEDNVYMEGFNLLLEAWHSILRDGQIRPGDFTSFSAVRLFDTYLQCHLAPPEGMRSQSVLNEEEDVDEDSADDRIRFRNQLTIIGLIGRCSLGHNAPLLTRLLESRADALQENLQQVHQALGHNADMSSAGQMLCWLYEDIHWLILLAGHILALDNDGETTLIPSEIMRYSINQTSNVDIDATLKVISSPNLRAVDCPGSERADHIVRLTAVIFRLCDIERRALENSLVSVLSPEVGTTLMWFLSHWSLSYLLPNETYYSEMSRSLNAAFGRDTQVGQWILEFLLNKINSNLVAWSSEPVLLNGTVQLLASLFESKDRCVCMLKCDHIWTILRQRAISNLAQLPKTAKQNLLKVLVLACLSYPETVSSEPLLMEVLQPLRDRLKALIYQDGFSRNYHDARLKMEAVHLLESFTGVARGCDITNAEYMFAYLFPILGECVALLDVYHNHQDVVELVLEFYCETAKRLICFLPEADSQNLYSCCLSMMQTFAKHNKGKQSREASAEEDQYRDVLLLIELLTNLLSKDFLNCATSEPDALESNVISAADIALLGLNIVMPMMNAELLRFPRLCLQYFKFVTFACELYPEKICHLPDELIKNLVASIELAFNNFGSEIINLCLDFLTVLGNYMFRTRQQSTLAFQLLRPFLKVVFDMMLLQTTELDIMLTASGTLFALICCYQDYFDELTQGLLASQTDPVYYQRLTNAFNNLMSGVLLQEDRPNRIKFRENFEKFVVEVRGFLCVK